MESVYSSSSSKFSTSAVHGRKLGGRQATMVSSGASEVRQRILSARMLRLKHLQNQLTVAQQQVFELSQENRSLKTMIRRQESALLKYDGANAELPQLLNSHAEEIRTWHAKYRELQKQNKDLHSKLKQKEQVILSISDENKHFQQLNRDRHLDEREKLANRVRELEARLVEKDNDTKLLARKLQLEAKSFRNQMHQESVKYREVCQKLDKATSEVTRLSTRLDVGERRMNGGAFLVRGFHQKNFLLRESHSAHFSSSLAPINHFRASGSSSACSKSPEETTPHRLEKLPATEPEDETQKRKEATKRDIKKVREIMKNAESSERSTTKSISSEECAGNLNGEELEDESEQAQQTHREVDADLSRKFERLSSKEDIKINEAILDEICENVIKNGFPEAPPQAVTFQKPKIQPTKRQPIDQKKKTKLLAALKAIDSNESFES
ncbi:myosin heavy chain, embryonic smooth muscle isoform [Phlebotomus argentipes]|uniref:myosin heavy chain, embryonic smooth muscle isoform n=1 Tax=Phlebotomus argentipes TaxID=94469 RepID=UPI0028933A3D|nr:myosin heavy chain, embryonic smooth muscle isoform [Phlebotomus argentipes]